MGEVVEFEESLLPRLCAHSLAFLDKMCRERIDSPFRKLLAACFAGVLISITRVVQLWPSLEVLKD